MAKKTKKWQIKPHAFVSSIVSDEARPPKARIIAGYIGKSNARGCIRVYLDVELRRYVDVPESGIIHYIDSRSAKNPMGSVLIWVKEKANIRHHGNWIATDDPSTMATGEEGGDPTTMATGEEGGGGLPDLLGPLINPFGQFG